MDVWTLNVFLAFYHNARCGVPTSLINLTARQHIQEFSDQCMRGLDITCRTGQIIVTKKQKRDSLPPPNKIQYRAKRRDVLHTSWKSQTTTLSPASYEVSECSDVRLALA